MNIKNLGQIFTPKNIVDLMLSLRKNGGNVLEPSAGNGAFSSQLIDCKSIEIDNNITSKDTISMDFFDYSIDNQFDTIIGNPPYVRNQDIIESTMQTQFIKDSNFDKRTNLYMYFIAKCLKHLRPKGEIIFITPRELFKATSAKKLNEQIYDIGCITHLIDLGDYKVFDYVNPNCVIWRFELGNKSKLCLYRHINDTNWSSRFFILSNGQLLFTKKSYSLKFSDLFSVHVGAVSGLDSVYESEEYGDTNFVNSKTISNNKTKPMIYNVSKDNPHLLKHKNQLINRKIKGFNESNWFEWGRKLPNIGGKKRIYVNCKTRISKPFYSSKYENFDGSVLAIVPHNQDIELQKLCELLNNMDWADLGFMCGNRYIFGQQSLENTFLSNDFIIFNMAGF